MRWTRTGSKWDQKKMRTSLDAQRYILILNNEVEQREVQGEETWLSTTEFRISDIEDSFHWGQRSGRKAVLLENQVCMYIYIYIYIYIYTYIHIYHIYIYQFRQSVMSLSLWPHGLQQARLPCPSATPGACSDSCPSSQWCHPTTSTSVVPFSSWCF